MFTGHDVAIGAEQPSLDASAADTDRPSTSALGPVGRDAPTPFDRAVDGPARVRNCDPRRLEAVCHGSDEPPADPREVGLAGIFDPDPAPAPEPERRVVDVDGSDGQLRVLEADPAGESHTVGYSYVKIFDTPGCRTPSRDDSRQYERVLDREPDRQRCGDDGRQRDQDGPEARERKRQREATNTAPPRRSGVSAASGRVRRPHDAGGAAC